MYIIQQKYPPHNYVRKLTWNHVYPGRRHSAVFNDSAKNVQLQWDVTSNTSSELNLVRKLTRTFALPKDIQLLSWYWKGFKLAHPCSQASPLPVAYGFKNVHQEVITGSLHTSEARQCRRGQGLPMWWSSQRHPSEKSTKTLPCETTPTTLPLTLYRSPVWTSFLNKDALYKMNLLFIFAITGKRYKQSPVGSVWTVSSTRISLVL